MPRAVFEARARLDLKGIYLHVAADSPSAALKLLRRFRDKCQFLAQFPQGGEARPELGKNVRCRGELRHLLPPGRRRHRCGARAARRPGCAAAVRSPAASG